MRVLFRLPGAEIIQVAQKYTLGENWVAYVR